MMVEDKREGGREGGGETDRPACRTVAAITQRRLDFSLLTRRAHTYDPPPTTVTAATHGAPYD